MAVGPTKKPEPVTSGDWNKLTCDCGGDIFMPAVFLRWKEGSGGTDSPHGHVCHACGAHVDQAHLIRVLQIKLKRQELREKEQEVEDIEGVEASTPRT